LSDVRGNLRRFDADAREGVANGKDVEPGQATGPRKANASVAQESPVPRKFQWGLEGMQAKRNESGLVASRSPFRNAETGQ